jgi:hypothetical protein
MKIKDDLLLSVDEGAATVALAGILSYKISTLLVPDPAVRGNIWRCLCVSPPTA